ncbi:hypothetical protein Cgig2_010078 [Carnegiea gigantea]|uniref:Uncharacterized protein n=1 Tax=Carnegiea gigantea TaxID=171969 RepID=A0A9Q1KL47_9CARY|nr:hypothetical protein Cgig2_010078 [Carnegiea gigantea]
MYKETNDTVEDTTYKMPPHWHKDETNSADEVLKKKNRARAKAKKERKSVQKCPSHAKRGQLSVVQHDHEKKSPKQQANTSIGVQDLKPVQNLTETETKHKEIFQSRMSPAGFVVDKFNKAQKQAIRDMGFRGFLEFGRKVEKFYRKNPKDPKYNEVLEEGVEPSR